MFNSRASAPASCIVFAYDSQPSLVVPLSEAMTGTFTAALILRICSRYSWIPKTKSSAFGKYASASADESAVTSRW